MIPLARWLANDAAEPEAFGAPLMAGFAPDFPAADTASHEQHIEEAYQRGRSEASAEGEERLMAMEAEHQSRMAAREAELSAEWSARFSAEVATGLASALTTMRREIEAGLERVLEPFLESEVRRKLVSALLQTVDEELAGTGQLPIEIAAPENLHAPLRAQCEQRGWSMPLTDSPEVRVAFRGGLLRFDEMSKHWAEVIRSTAS